MKNIIKNIILITIVFIVVAPLIRVSAATSDVKTVSATISGTTISYSGTTDSGVVAVTCKLLDSSSNEIDLLSSAVSSNSFTGTFNVTTAGEYKVSCANYDGGTAVTVDVDDKVEITNIKITLKNPTPGDKITLTHVDEGGFGYDEPDKLAEATSSTTGLKVDAAHYIKGVCSATSDDCEEYFEGTFEDGEEYYVMIFVSSKDGYKLTNNSLEGLKINGEDPEEVFTIYSDITGTTNTMFVAKVKATTQTTSTTANETTSPKTNDMISIYVGLLIISISGIIATVSLRKKKVNQK